MKKNTSDIAVITAAKDLCKYVMNATSKSPKQFRMSFVSRMQNLSLDIIENLLKANLMRLNTDENKYRIRFQRRADLSLKMLDYIAMVSRECGCILPNQHENICKMLAETQSLLGGWINNDKKRRL